MEQNIIKRKKDENNRNDRFWKIFLIMGLLALAVALVFMIILRQGAAGKAVPSREIHHFEGTVGTSVHMSIIIDGTNVKGKYYYDTTRKPFMLYGEKKGDRLYLTDSYAGKISGWFDGNLDLGVFKGSFTRAKDGKVFDFNLVVVEGGPGFFSENEICF